MATTPDIWFVLLPDGRILRSRSTEALRKHLQAGRLPRDVRVRRSAEEPWQTLDQVSAFADLAQREEAPEEAPEPQVKARPLPELRTLGLRGLVDELFNAFDSSLQRPKLTTSACSGLAIGVVLVFANMTLQMIPAEWHWLGYLVTAFVLLILFSVCTTILTQLTALELSRYRPAQFSEVRGETIGHALRVTCALGLVGGAIAGFILLMRALPDWLVSSVEEPGPWIEMAVNVITGARLIFEVICWPILGFALLLLGPIMIVEEHSVVRGLREWVGMLRQHLGRIYLYQAIAFAYAFVLTLPLLIPMLLAFSYVGGLSRSVSLGESVPFLLLFGVALTPMLNYLLVAHVFMYINLRYEFFYSSRDR
jgi:hypothetical protein